MFHIVALIRAVQAYFSPNATEFTEVPSVTLELEDQKTLLAGDFEVQDSQEDEPNSLSIKLENQKNDPKLKVFESEEVRARKKSSELGLNSFSDAHEAQIPDRIGTEFSSCYGKVSATSSDRGTFQHREKNEEEDSSEHDNVFLSEDDEPKSVLQTSPLLVSQEPCSNPQSTVLQESSLESRSTEYSTESESRPEGEFTKSQSAVESVELHVLESSEYQSHVFSLSSNQAESSEIANKEGYYESTPVEESKSEKNVSHDSSTSNLEQNVRISNREETGGSHVPYSEENSSVVSVGDVRVDVSNSCTVNPTVVVTKSTDFESSVPAESTVIQQNVEIDEQKKKPLDAALPWTKAESAESDLDKNEQIFSQSEPIFKKEEDFESEEISERKLITADSQIFCDFVSSDEHEENEKLSRQDSNLEESMHILEDESNAEIEFEYVSKFEEISQKEISPTEIVLSIQEEISQTINCELLNEKDKAKRISDDEKPSSSSADSFNPEEQTVRASDSQSIPEKNSGDKNYLTVPYGTEEDIHSALEETLSEIDNLSEGSSDIADEEDFSGFIEKKENSLDKDQEMDSLINDQSNNDYSPPKNYPDSTTVETLSSSSQASGGTGRSNE